ncbi:glycoside hydrolase [Hydrogenimonas sp. SS33]|uniref:glycoside hydrolase n=1 Tax=Hydrogenimonas leucolamina TaxID=2954236 RepID=UPI00336BB522
MPLKLSFFWHMHQPDYRQGDGKMHMPWVFLHAIKDYYEMPWLLSKHAGIKATFNLTPPLIEQMILYTKKGADCDTFLTLWRKDPGDLSAGERAFVDKICHASQYDTMVKPLKRYAELFHKENLDAGEFMELEVLFMLSWCGNYLRRNDPTVRRLLAKGRGYTKEEKEALLKALLDFMPHILPFYADLMKQGRISLATTPLNHPILPLLLDMENAVRSNPKTVIPANHFPLKEDAEAQVDRAIALYEEVFGCKPTGFWPAEGAVDEQSVAIYKDRGLRWIATDEAILMRSMGYGKKERGNLYQRYAFDGLFIAFRDHALSDLIGFTYRYWEAERSADDFMQHLESISETHPDGSVSVILDGENAWEFYPDNGFGFFEALYARLGDCRFCTTVTMDELSEKPEVAMPKLHPGSWIYGTFDTWVGHPEKNAAWERIYQTKHDYLHHEKSLDEKRKAEIADHFLAAECSDWFWWYGEDHHTDYAAEFDELFRSHLIAVYRLMNLTPPANLFQPIAGERKDLHALVNEPKFPIQPMIDGRVTSFFEWLGSGMIDETKLYSTMDRVRGPITAIHWGQDRDSLYFRLDGEIERLKTDGEIKIYIEGLDDTIDIDLSLSPVLGDLSYAAEEIVEIGISKRLHFHGLSEVTVRLEILEKGHVVQVLPGIGELTVDLNEDYAKNWFV